MSKNITKLSIFFGISLFILWGVNFALLWHSPEVNNEAADDIGNCLYKNAHKSLHFNISYTTNADKTCVNPSFPIIHIKTKQEHNAWLHIVRTDYPDENLQEFIDGDIKFDYPFYN
nr:hypothetical protein [Rickettsia endosymbiont of Ceutorhynchus assimilis]